MVFCAPQRWGLLMSSGWVISSGWVVQISLKCPWATFYCASYQALVDCASYTEKIEKSVNSWWGWVEFGEYTINWPHRSAWRTKIVQTAVNWDKLSLKRRVKNSRWNEISRMDSLQTCTTPSNLGSLTMLQLAIWWRPLAWYYGNSQTFQHFVCFAFYVNTWGHMIAVFTKET